MQERTTGVEGKVVAITGASRGIGEATAILLAARGAKVVLGARDETRLRAVAEGIAASGGEVAFRPTDVARREDLDALVAHARTRFGRLDVLVNNAGVGYVARTDELRVGDWEAMIDVNLKGVLYGVAAALPGFREQESGHVVNTVSTAGLKIVPEMGVYAATKNAVRTLMEALRQENVPGLRVTNVSPGFVRTEFVAAMPDSDTKAAMQKTADEIAISPEAVARTILFAIEQPADVEVSDIVIRPTAQG